jgi:hypothetical protein
MLAEGFLVLVLLLALSVGLLSFSLCSPGAIVMRRPAHMNRAVKRRDLLRSLPGQDVEMKVTRAPYGQRCGTVRAKLARALHVHRTLVRRTGREGIL